MKPVFLYQHFFAIVLFSLTFHCSNKLYNYAVLCIFGPFSCFMSHYRSFVIRTPYIHTWVQAIHACTSTYCALYEPLKRISREMWLLSKTFTFLLILNIWIISCGVVREAFLNSKHIIYYKYRQYSKIKLNVWISTNVYLYKNRNLYRHQKLRYISKVIFLT